MLTWEGDVEWKDEEGEGRTNDDANDEEEDDNELPWLLVRMHGMHTGEYRNPSSLLSAVSSPLDGEELCR